MALKSKTCKHLLLLFLTLLVSLLLGGCGGGSAINRTANYTYAWPSISYSMNSDLTVGIIDKRPYVVSGRNKDTFVGLMRGGFGNPWYMSTESGKPLAEDIAHAVVSGFMNAGTSTGMVVLTPKMSQKDIVDRFATVGSKRKILITINEWKSDTFRTTTFLYDLTAEVYNGEGVVISSYAEENISTSGENQPVTSAVDAGREALGRLLGNEAIAGSLSLAEQGMNGRINVKTAK